MQEVGCVKSQCLQIRCFYQFENVTASLLNTIKIVVKNNNASHTGDNLFGGLVDYCNMIDDDDLNIIDSLIFNIPVLSSFHT